MPLLSPSLRKVAVLVSALDDDAADIILEHLGPDDAAKVRSALVELTDIAAHEQQQVLAEFLNQKVDPRSASADDVALALDPRLEAAAAVASDVAPPPIPASRSPLNPFAFLSQVDPRAIARAIAAEHPQTAAVVVAQLAPEHAAAVLQELPTDFATDALERIAWLDELSADIQADVATALRHQLSPHLKTAAADASSIAQLSAVIGAMDFRHRQRALLRLSQRNTALLHRLGLSPPSDTLAPDPGRWPHRYRLDSESPAVSAPANVSSAFAHSDIPDDWLTFDDLLSLDDTALKSIFAAVDADVVLLALTGAPPRWIARILRKLPPPDAALLRTRLEHPGPVRLREIEQARAALAATASRLAHEGIIHLPASARFAAAV